MAEVALDLIVRYRCFSDEYSRTCLVVVDVDNDVVASVCHDETCFCLL